MRRIKALTLVVCLCLGIALPVLAAKIESHSYGGGAYWLALEHIFVGHLVSEEVRGNDVTLQFSTGMAEAVNEWIVQTLAGKAPQHEGAIVAVNYDHQEIGREEFTGAMMTGVEFPALDASSKDLAKMKIQLRVASITTLQTKAGTSHAEKMSETVKKKWLPSNFRFRIDGLDQECEKVNKISAITIQQTSPHNLTVSDISFTLPESHAAEVFKWLQSPQPKNGTLEMLTPDLREQIVTLNLQGLTVLKVTPDKAESHNEAIRRVKVDMSCQGVTARFAPTW